MRELLRQYIDETCISNPSATVLVKDVLGGFRTWAISRGHSGPKRHEVLATIRELGFPIGIRSERAHIVGLQLKTPRLTVQDGRVVRASI